MELETVNKLYLELSQVATAKTARELELEDLLTSARAIATQQAAPAFQDAEDAARYRWLRDMHDWYAEPRIDELDGTKWQLTFYSPQRIEDAMDDDSLDAAVDAARKQGCAT